MYFQEKKEKNLSLSSLFYLSFSFSPLKTPRIFGEKVNLLTQKGGIKTQKGGIKPIY